MAYTEDVSSAYNPWADRPATSRRSSRDTKSPPPLKCDCVVCPFRIKGVNDKSGDAVFGGASATHLSKESVISSGIGSSIHKPIFAVFEHNEDGGDFQMVPMLQKPAPDFSGTGIHNGEIKDIKISDYKGKYVVLFFYPLDFTFVCPTEIIAFSDRAEEFRKIGCEVIAASCDSHFSHLAWVNTPRKQGGLGEIDIPILADKSGKVAKSYGVYNEETGIPFRGLFVIDKKQILRQITINDLPVGRSVDETLRLVNAFMFTDEHGEVCPANWTPGSKTMKADPVGSKAYFSAVN